MTSDAAAPLVAAPGTALRLLDTLDRTLTDAGAGESAETEGEPTP